MPTFTLRLRTPTGERLQIGPIATHAEANALARSYLGDGRARRVEVLVRRHGRWQLVGVLGRPQHAPMGPPVESEPATAPEEAGTGRDDAN